MTKGENLRISLAELEVLLDAATIASSTQSDMFRFSRKTYQEVVNDIIERMRENSVEVWTDNA